MDFVKQARSTQSDVLMSSLNRLRGNNFLCDFTVKVGNKSFPVHRNVLAASSEYFESMFSSNMKEVHDGFIDMKDVDQDGITQCIEFMYKGEADLKIENIQHILKASHLLQMVVLTNLCFQYLQSILSPTNCLSVINLARAFHYEDLKEKAEQIAVDNFDSVISSEMFPFINKSDLLRYMKNASYQTSWQAALIWAKGKDDADFADIFAVNIGKFPINFFLKTVLEEPLVERNEITKNSVIVALFSDVKNLERNLEIDNCFILKNLAKTHQVNDPTVEEVINHFMEANFEHIIAKREFCDISKNEFVRLFKSSNTKYSVETVKWQAMLSWVKHVKNRKKHFPELFSFLKLKDLSLGFLKQTVRVEPLVKNSDKCTDSLIEEIFSRAQGRANENRRGDQAPASHASGVDVPRLRDSNSKIERQDDLVDTLCQKTGCSKIAAQAAVQSQGENESNCTVWILNNQYNSSVVQRLSLAFAITRIQDQFSRS